MPQARIPGVSFHKVYSAHGPVNNALPTRGRHKAVNGEFRGASGVGCFYSSSLLPSTLPLTLKLGNFETLKPAADLLQSAFTNFRRESIHSMQRWSKLFIPTLREAPADAEVASHKFLVRSGYVRQLAAGIYSYLFLAQRTILKITNIVRQEMDTIGQELYLPALNPREVWEASGRWDVMGDNMFRLKDRKGADLCLGMTHEEIMTDIARKELRSYKQLPQIWYQIQTKFRDEPRPKSGLLRVRQFTMKDSYSFDIDRDGLDKSFDLHDAVYRRIFARCGLDFVAVEADSGSMGGSQSQEFMVYTDAGEDLVASCAKCGYAANLEKATSKLDAVEELAANARRSARKGLHAGNKDDRRGRRVPEDSGEQQHEVAGLRDERRSDCGGQAGCTVRCWC